MNGQHRSYIVRETLVGILINGLLSAAFALAVFGLRGRAALSDIIFDALPQSFMIALMTTLVPTLLTRKRMRLGQIAPGAVRSVPLPRNLFARALLVAVAAALIGGALHWLLLPSLAPPIWTSAAVLIYKIGYGCALAALIAPFILRRALAERGPR